MGRYDDRVNDFFEEGRPGRLTSRDFSQQDFPFDAFEFQEYDKVDEPIIKAASPWQLQIDAANITGTLVVGQIDGLGGLAELNTIDLTYVDDAGEMAALDSNALVYTSTEAPDDPAVHPLWADTSAATAVLKKWNGATWDTVATFNTGDLADLDTVGDSQITDITGGKIATGSIESTGYDETTPVGALKIDLDNSMIRTDNFVSGSAGWKIDGDGSVEFNNGVFRGSLDAASGTFGSFGTSTGVEIKNSNIYFTDSNIFGGTNKATIGQGSLGNLILEGDNAVVLSAGSESIQFFPAFNGFYPSDPIRLGKTYNPWGEIYHGNAKDTSYGKLVTFTLNNTLTQAYVYDLMNYYLYTDQRVACMGTLDGKGLSHIIFRDSGLNRVLFIDTSGNPIVTCHKDDTNTLWFGGTFTFVTGP